MMLKLYKRTGDSTSYWEAWDDGKNVTIHFGILGKRGESKEISISFWKTAKKIILKESAGPLSQGYKEIDAENLVQFIVQYPIEGMGSSADLDKAEKVENLLSGCLGWTGNGHCDGNDIGSGTLNLFSFVVDPVVASKSVVDDLKKVDLLKDSVIAYRKDEEYIVLYPDNYSEKFKL